MKQNEYGWVYHVYFRTRFLDQTGKRAPGLQGRWYKEWSLFCTRWELERDGVGALEDALINDYLLDYGHDIENRLKGLDPVDWKFEAEITRIEQLHQNDQRKVIYQK